MTSDLLGVGLVVFAIMAALFGDRAAKAVKRRARRKLKSWWRRKRREAWKELWRRKPRWSPASPFGVYVYVAINPATGKPTHGKVGEGKVDDRLRTHRTSTTLEVKRIVRTATKAEAKDLQDRVLAALKAAGLMLPAKPGEGKELFMAVPDAFRIINAVIAEEVRGVEAA